MNLSWSDIVSGRQVEDAGGQGVPREVGSFVVIFQEIFKERDQVVALAEDGPAGDETVNDSLKKESVSLKMIESYNKISSASKVYNHDSILSAKNFSYRTSCL